MRFAEPVERFAVNSPAASPPQRLALMLLGRQRSGKSTVAHLLRDGFGAAIYELKAPAVAIAREEYGRTEREPMLLIRICNDLRSKNPAFLAEMAWARAYTDPARVVVFADVRMEAEYRYLRDQGVVPVILRAPKEVRQARPGFVAEREDDATERDADRLPGIVVENTGTLEDLRIRVHRLIADLTDERRETRAVPPVAPEPRGHPVP